MNTYPTLADEFRLVTENLKSREWIQGEMQRGDAVCAHGAVQTCKGLRPGDEHIIRAVMRTKGLTEDWNDRSGRTKDEVVTKLASLIEITDEDLAETFGPSWSLVVAVIRRAALLTSQEADDLAAALDAAGAAARAAARAAAVADLVGQHGLTQDHIDTLMKPWVSVLGADWQDAVR
ncbi:hypothetical protein [Mycobacterium sp. NAZ190054]|uniref:DUF6197 family protein n=1 Tax=Mycobacterium sp. NAZ190054 TaxID=1747766 RepID=UPI000798FEC0|nr:hypothetical protein [Mycobacterium sp. NAZ190054]KWX66845.1 hypothetical protein ASJ79_05625 [Mycobacterium sp. NAZ190054]